ncbi:PhoU domain-containing protein [Candidatus Latescibacterota bacterium]
MFREIIRIWSEQAFSKRVVNEFLTMLEDSEKMLAYVFKVLTVEGKGKKFDKKIYKKDQRINLTERDIRKQILVHLTAHPSANLPACLALISVVKDAERLGDYVKNLFELKALLKDSDDVDYGLFKRLFNENGTELQELFQKVSTAFKNSDKELAYESIQVGYAISNRCEEIIEEVVNSKDTARQAVVAALGARYLKRIAIHLTNIVSSVTNPLPDVDFVDGKSATKNQ